MIKRHCKLKFCNCSPLRVRQVNPSVQYPTNVKYLINVQYPANVRYPTVCGSNSSDDTAVPVNGWREEESAVLVLRWIQGMMLGHHQCLPSKRAPLGAGQQMCGIFYSFTSSVFCLNFNETYMILSSISSYMTAAALSTGWLDCSSNPGGVFKK